MPTLISVAFELEGISMPKIISRRAFTGRDRALLRKLKASLLQVLAMDTRRAESAMRAGVPPVLYNAPDDTVTAEALNHLVVRTTMALETKVSPGAVPQ